MKKHLKTTLLLAVCISLLAGCAQNDTASDSTADASSQSEISSTSETTTSAMSDTSVVDAPTAPAADALVTADGNFLYEECDGSITITKYVGKSEEITTPKEINGKPVTKIGENAFRCEYMEFPTAYDSECGDWIYVPYFGNAKHIVLSEGITELGPYAFSDYTIESVDIPSTVTIVGEGCFSECSVKCIEFPSEQPVSVGEGAFENKSLSAFRQRNFRSSIGMLLDTARCWLGWTESPKTPFLQASILFKTMCFADASVRCRAEIGGTELLTVKQKLLTIQAISAK